MPKVIRVSAAIVLSAACLSSACTSASGSNATSSNNSGGGGFGGGGGGGFGGGGFGGGGRGGGGRGGRGGPGGGDVPVVTGKVAAKDVPVELAAIGNVEAATTISVRSQVGGILQGVFLSEGDFVSAGAHLFTIDPRPYEAALKQAEANLTRDEALLKQAEAQLTRDAANAEYTQSQLERQNELVTKGIISKDQAEQARAAADASQGVISADKASIESARAQLEAQRAAVDNSRVQLDYTTIKSPITGRTGNLSVKAGNLVNANNTELMTIAQIEPILVTFTVPAVHLPNLKRYMAEGAIEAVATPQDAEAAPVTGRLTFIDNAVDSSTDTIKLKAAFENKDHRLWPGQFARINLKLSTIKSALVVPSQTVQTGQDGQFVFVVKPDFTVEQRNVTTGQASGTDTVVQKGLELGETVVVEGQLRLESGTRITNADGRSVGGGGNRGGRGGRGGPGGGQGNQGAAGGRRGQ